MTISSPWRHDWKLLKNFKYFSNTSTNQAQNFNTRPTSHGLNLDSAIALHCLRSPSNFKFKHFSKFDPKWNGSKSSNSLQLQDEHDEQQLQTSTSKIGSKSRLSYDWLSLALIPNWRSGYLIANGGLEIMKRPNSLITKIPNSSYLRHVDRARYREGRSTIFQTLIKRTWYRELASTIVGSSALD